MRQKEALQGEIELKKESDKERRKSEKEMEKIMNKIRYKLMHFICHQSIVNFCSHICKQKRKTRAIFLHQFNASKTSLTSFFMEHQKLDKFILNIHSLSSFLCR